MRRPVQRPARPAWAAIAAAVAAVVSASCSSSGSVKVEPEAFSSTTTHSRVFTTAPAFTCEAARRALLSQGFVILAADADHVNGRKNFQPEPESHVEIEFQTTCVPEGRGAKKTIAFVNALQDRYALKKSNNSASVGVPALGSLSLPFLSSDDAMVKVSSETITSAPFYDRFFVLLQRYLEADADMLPDPKAEAQVIVPEPVHGASAPAGGASAPHAATAAASAAAVAAGASAIAAAAASSPAAASAASPASSSAPGLAPAPASGAASAAEPEHLPASSAGG